MDFSVKHLVILMHWPWTTLDRHGVLQIHFVVVCFHFQTTFFIRKRNLEMLFQPQNSNTNKHNFSCSKWRIICLEILTFINAFLKLSENLQLYIQYFWWQIIVLTCSICNTNLHYHSPHAYIINITSIALLEATLLRSFDEISVSFNYKSTKNEKFILSAVNRFG